MVAHFILVLFTIHFISAQENERASQIERIVQKYFESGQFTGTILVADRKGIIYKGAFGYADRETKRELTVETPFYLASVSKQFTASAALMLVSEGKLKLDDPITKYLDGLPSFCDEIKIRYLLNHTSGLPDYYNVIEPPPGFKNEDVHNFVISLSRPVFPPGSQYAYNSTGYVLMSSIVQSICNQEFSSFMNERIFVPLGMINTYVLDNKSIKVEGKAIGYSEEGKVDDYNFLTTGGGGIYSTVYDLYLWDRALYTGKPVSKFLQKSQAYKPSTLSNVRIRRGPGDRTPPRNPRQRSARPAERSPGDLKEDGSCRPECKTAPRARRDPRGQTGTSGRIASQSRSDRNRPKR